jgi:hypothetical protein
MLTMRWIMARWITQPARALNLSRSRPGREALFKKLSAHSRAGGGEVERGPRSAMTFAALLGVKGNALKSRLLAGFSVPGRVRRILLFSILLRRGNDLDSTLFQPKKLLPSSSA